MKIKRLLFGLSLTMMILGTAYTPGKPVKADACTDVCADLYRDCEAACNGGRLCVQQCQEEYIECMCGCGNCPNPPYEFP